MEFPSKVIENGVNELASLPGVGKKTALRLALHILKGTEEDAETLGKAIIALRRDILYCRTCGNISDHDVCKICTSHRRDQGVVCVVEDCKDVIAIENTGQYTGTYHVINGVIHPMQGIGPSELNIDSLVVRVGEENIKEIIFCASYQHGRRHDSFLHFKATERIRSSHFEYCQRYSDRFRSRIYR